MATAVQTPPPQPPAARKTISRKIPSPRRKSKSPRRGNVDPDRLPTPEEIEKCGQLPILNKQGISMPFRDLYADGQRHLVIFVRHFFCGMCQDFLRVLATSITPADLASLPSPTKLTIIGCGSHELIEDYASYSKDLPFSIYADPSRQLYDAFGMTSSLDQGEVKPSYQTSNFAAMIVRNMWQVLSSGTAAVKGGNFSQLGGEMLFENEKPVWCHRMRNTRDHVEVDELKKLLGM